MQLEILKNGWVRAGSVIAFPHGWQRPAKTEEWIYEVLIDKNVNSALVEFISFPWATLIDLLSRNQFERAKAFITALNNLPVKRSLLRATCCQHINLHLIQGLLKKIKITDIFWAHKSIHEDNMDSIRLHPLALYPYAYYSLNDRELKPLEERKYKYSFVGAYDPQGYLSDIREKIFNMPKNEVSFVKRRDHWHFEKQVYSSQIMQLDVSAEDIRLQHENEEEYIYVMSESILSLCPSGAGLNTIRYWESISLGCIPVVFSKDYERPAGVNAFELLLTENNLYEDLRKLDIKYLVEKYGNEHFKNIDPVTWLSNIYINYFEEKNIFNLIGESNG